MVHNEKKTKTLVLTAMFAAIICVTTAFLFHIPTGVNGGYIHIGDAFIYLAACILPKPYAMLAAAIGAGLSDAISPGGMVWVIPTMIIKPILVLFFTSKKNTIICKQNTYAIFIAGAVGILGYYLATGIIFGDFKVAIVSFLMGFLQPIGSGIAFMLLGGALDKIKISEKIGTKIS
ncbi:TIGR04002 family protein [Hathewaya massiliensis]|uniref:TIGR04002 family protein n=1 Tax=Hathewaya massiliensis TaxID=1964382 RepID=UPI00115B2062|nr:TIGR04002 family protein [Hathewaya massiliensis]